jgi:hypothetical protein
MAAVVIAGDTDGTASDSMTDSVHTMGKATEEDEEEEEELEEVEAAAADEAEACIFTGDMEREVVITVGATAVDMGKGAATAVAGDKRETLVAAPVGNSEGKVGLIADVAVAAVGRAPAAGAWHGRDKSNEEMEKEVAVDNGVNMDVLEVDVPVFAAAAVAVVAAVLVPLDEDPDARSFHENREAVESWDARANEGNKVVGPADAVAVAGAMVVEADTGVVDGTVMAAVAGRTDMVTAVITVFFQAGAADKVAVVVVAAAAVEIDVGAVKVTVFLGAAGVASNAAVVGGAASISMETLLASLTGAESGTADASDVGATASRDETASSTSIGISKSSTTKSVAGADVAVAAAGMATGVLAPVAAADMSRAAAAVTGTETAASSVTIKAAMNESTAVWVVVTTVEVEISLSAPLAVAIAMDSTSGTGTKAGTVAATAAAAATATVVLPARARVVRGAGASTVTGAATAAAAAPLRPRKLRLGAVVGASTIMASCDAT